MTTTRTSFLAAATAFVDQVSRIPADTLDGPGLGDWDLRALVGHTSRSLVTVETYLDRPATEAVVVSAAQYYLAIADALGAGGTEIVERGRQAGLALGDDPAAFLHDLTARVAGKLAAYDAGYLLTTIAGGMRLDEYLRTRTFELVVHGYDISAACGTEASIDPRALVDAATLAAEVAVARGQGEDLLLSLSGRRPLPEGFSIV